MTAEIFIPHRPAPIKSSTLAASLQNAAIFTKPFSIMRTTYKQQMAAIKFAIKRRQRFIAIKNKSSRVSYKLGHTDKKKFYRYAEDKNWLALNDAYSTLAAVALNESLNKKSGLISFVLPSPLPGRGGWGNGYVALPKEHSDFGKDYDSIFADVSGGLTYSASDIVGQPKETAGMWIVGFDTLHCDDSMENWPTSESVLLEANKLKNQLEKH